MGKFGKRGLGSPHLTNNNEIGPHCQHHFHKIPETDLARAIEGRRTGLVIRTVNKRHMEFTHFLARANAMISRNRRDQRRQKRSLAGAGGS